MSRCNTFLLKAPLSQNVAVYAALRRLAGRPSWRPLIFDGNFRQPMSLTQLERIWGLCTFLQPRLALRQLPHSFQCRTGRGLLGQIGQLSLGPPQFQFGECLRKFGTGSRQISVDRKTLRRKRRKNPGVLAISEGFHQRTAAGLAGHRGSPPDLRDLVVDGLVTLEEFDRDLRIEFAREHRKSEEPAQNLQSQVIDLCRFPTRIPSPTTAR